MRLSDNGTSATKIGIQSNATGTTTANSQTIVGIEGSATTGSGNPGAAIGVRGFAGYNPSNGGRNYGVYGALSSGGMSGAAVFGTVNAYPLNNTPIALSGEYAGYFKGRVTITDNLNTPLITWTSDYRYKQNIAELDREKTVDKLFGLNPVEYNFTQRYLTGVDSVGNAVKVACYDEKSELYQRKHYGLIAQEVQQLYPELVYEDGEGYLSINYIGLIPLLIESVKELKAEVDNVKATCCNTGSLLESNSAAVGQEADMFAQVNEQPAELYQNVPNPFSASTEISYYLPASVNKALLCIYDMNGRQLKQVSIAERGNGSQTISGSALSAGIYLYALIADGEEVDVKRMILTE